MSRFQTDPHPVVGEEIRSKSVPVHHLVSEAESYLGKADVDDVALARMFIERGYSDELSYWIVREAHMKHAAG
jgi:hypothetical protein